MCCSCNLPDIEATRKILLTAVHESTGPPLYKVLCPDWITWAGMPEQLFSLLLYEQEEDRHNSGHCWNIALFNTCFNNKISPRATLSTEIVAKKCICFYFGFNPPGLTSYPPIWFFRWIPCCNDSSSFPS